MNNLFLAVNKSYLNTDLQPIDILILSQIAEFQRNQCDCLLTNEQFSKMFGTTLYAVKTSLDKLENQKYITRSVSFTGGRGRANKQRLIKLNESQN